MLSCIIRKFSLPAEGKEPFNITGYLPEMSKIPSATFDPGSESLTLGENTVQLNHMAAACLHLLVLRQGEIVSKEEILKACWSDRGIIVSDASVRQVLFQLRKALNDAGLNAGCLSNVQRKGYRLASGSILLAETTVPDNDSFVPDVISPDDGEDSLPGPALNASPGIKREISRDDKPLRQGLMRGALLVLSLLISFLMYSIRTGELVQHVHYEFAARMDDASIYFQQDAELDKSVVLNVLRTLIDRKYIFPSLNNYIYVNQTYSNSIVTLFVCRAPLDQPDSRCYSLVAEDRQ